jgi:hypothetical protein
MAEKSEGTSEPTGDEGISEDDLRKMIGEELDSRLSTITDSLGGLADSIFDKLKGEGGSGATETVSEDNLLEKIGSMIDEKLKGIGTGNAKAPREPKLKIFS